MAKSNKNKVAGLEQYASKSALMFSGSLIVISLALNNSGFSKIIDAYAEHIVADIEHEQKCQSDDLNKLFLDVAQLKKDSHPQN